MYSFVFPKYQLDDVSINYKTRNNVLQVPNESDLAQITYEFCPLKFLKNIYTGCLELKSQILNFYHIIVTLTEYS